jgi:hypothetical protein
MKIIIKRGGGVPFARKLPYEYDGTKYEADLQNGDTVKILDAGSVEMGQFGEQKNFKIKTRNGEKKLAFNQQTQNVLAEELGDESELWIGKDVKVILKKDTIAGKKVIIPYLITEGWLLDDYGDLVKDVKPAEQGAVPMGDSGVEYPEEDIDPKDIPF